MSLARALSQRAGAAARAPGRLQPGWLHRRPLHILLSLARRKLGHVQRVRQHAGVCGNDAAAGHRRRCVQRHARVRPARGDNAVAGSRRVAA